MGVVVPNFASSTEDRASGAQIVDGSLKFDSGSSQHLKRTFSAGNRKTWTWSGWVKRSKISGSSQIIYSGVQDGNNGTVFYFDPNSCLNFFNYVSAAYAGRRVTTPVYRDSSSWYHVILVWDSTNTTTSNRIRIYVNGSEVTQFSTNTDPGSADSIVNSANAHYIGADVGFNNFYSNQYLSNVTFIDGQALGPEYFGYTDPLTNTWRPKKAEIPGFNDGTVWSSNSTNFTNPGQGFNGNTADYAEVSSSAAKGTFTFPKSIQVENNVTFIYSSGTAGNLFVNDSSTAMQGTSFQVQTISFSGTLTDISLQSASQPVLYYFSVDGKPLIDSVTNNFGNNGFYLPLDGNSPIGEDKSGKGNNFTPVNFGGSNTIEKATGALPILNTVNGGNVATAGVRTDSNASSLVLALPLVGIKSDFSNQINSGSTTKVMTSIGNAAASSSSSNFYGGSYYFDGTGDGISSPDNTDFEFGSGDFTVECWVKQADTSGFDVYVGKYGGSSDGEFIVGKNGNTPTFYWQDAGGNNNINATNFTGNTTDWYHMACVREGDVFTMYINGICENSTTDATTIKTTTNKLTIGIENDSSSSPFNGYLQDVRIYKGVAKYSGTTVGTQYFIPASTNPDILPDTPSGVSGGSKLTKITDGAVAFDGNGDYLSVPATDEFTFGTGDFTIETFIYHNTLGASGNTIIDFRNASDNTDAGALWKTSGGEFGWYVNGANRVTGATVAANKWYHLALVRNSGTTSLYVDGISVGSFSDSYDYATKSGRAFIGALADGSGTLYLDAFISNFRILKGTALYTANFTPPTSPLTNVTNTQLLCCQSVGIATAAVVGIVTANGNAAPTNFNPFNTDINTVRGQETGYATLNPLDKLSNVVLTNGNLTCTSGANVEGVRSTIPFPRTGMWYVEYHMDTVTTGGYPVTGIANASKSLSAYAGTGTASVRPVGSARNLGWVIDSTDTPAGYMWTGFALSAGGDTMQIVFNADKGAYYMGVNNSFWGLNSGTAIRVTPQDMLNGTYSAYDVSGDDYFAWAVPYEGKCTLNYGQKPFKFPPPDGFQPLNDANVRPSTVIARPDQYVGVTTYVGDSGTQSVNVGMNPDLVWIKHRGSGNDNHALFDTVRGTSKRLSSSLTDQEQDPGPWGNVSAFNSNGFTVSGANSYEVNYLNNNYVAWTWKAGGNSNTFNVDDVGYASAAAAGLDGGSGITISGASVGTKQGFSIIQYAGSDNDGDSVAHGLLDTPSFIIIKDLSETTNWRVWHKVLGYSSITNILKLNSDAGSAADNDRITAVDSTKFTLTQTGGTGGGVNKSGNNYIAYCWHDVPGLQKFGSYEGNGVADGPYIELGFRPAIVLVKNIDTGGTNYDWVLYDNERAKYNPDDKFLCPNLEKAENVRGDNTTDNARYVDFLSNGFKVRNDSSPVNASETIIYAAWAEAPEFNLYGAQSNAR